MGNTVPKTYWKYSTRPEGVYLLGMIYVTPRSGTKERPTPHDSVHVEQRCTIHSRQVMPVLGGSQLRNSCYGKLQKWQILPYFGFSNMVND